MQFQFTAVCVHIYVWREDSVLWLFLSKYLMCGKPREFICKHSSKKLLKRTPRVTEENKKMRGESASKLSCLDIILWGNIKQAKVFSSHVHNSSILIESKAWSFCSIRSSCGLAFKDFVKVAHRPGDLNINNSLLIKDSLNLMEKVIFSSQQFSHKFPSHLHIKWRT